ncbi:hypothetical protein C0J52_21952 [Blattella germanica]|nr:hypothetical protein C0J52_21952 [Blattella germanica]
MVYSVRRAKLALQEKLRKINADEELMRFEQKISKRISEAKHSTEITKIKESTREAFLNNNVYFNNISFNIAGIPVYSPGVRRPLADVLQPLEDTPHATINREPWWWTYPSLRPHVEELKALPAHLRDSYLSPVKSVFHWYEHPFRPLGKFQQ